MFLEGVCVGLLGLVVKKALITCINLHIYILTLLLLLAYYYSAMYALLSFFSLLLNVFSVIENKTKSLRLYEFLIQKCLLLISKHYDVIRI